MSAPTVSILIPCHNAERWIRAAIESALAQTYPHIEVIVVDDGSTDGSWPIINSFGGRIRCETGPNRGSNPARNRLLEMASGEWVQYLDADDYLLPDKVAVQVQALESRPGVDVVYSPVVMEYCEDSAAGRQDVLPIPPPHDPWVLLVRWLLPQTGAALWRRAAIVQVGGWKRDQPCCQEHELYLRLLKGRHVFEYSEYAGAVYRQWSTTTLCRRDPVRTIRRRLEVVRAAETFLQETERLTVERQNAIAHARLECARSLFNLNRPQALVVVRELQARHPQFRLPDAPPFPPAYRMVYGLLGFEWAESIAQVLRPIRRNMRHFCQTH